MIEKPQILTLNLPDKTNKILEDNNYNIYTGSLGKLIETKNEKHELKYCLLNHDFPVNIHEFDIVIIDLSNEIKIPYDKKENTRNFNKTKNNLYILSEYPQTIFDPRAFSATILNSEIQKITKRDSIVIVFQDDNETITYEMAEENGAYPDRKGKKECNLYSFMPTCPFSQNKIGKETTTALENGEFKKLLDKYNSDFSYRTTYYHPKTWEGEEHILKPNFYPLVKNKDEEIVSFAYLDEKYGLYLFPVLKDISNFLLEFLQSIAPTIHPKVFPFSTEKKWVQNEKYYLPNHKNLIQERQLLKEEYESKIEKKNEEINKNNQKYQFLHDIITETGDELVKALIKYLDWLGFKKIIDVDSEKSELKEEDLQIVSDKGLLVIEVKGIGGTSKDSECSQISKIKYRRAEERGTFDVFGLYIVNHQRHLPPSERRNPPFTKQQLADAKNDKRGLLTTWQLFNLYFDILDGVLTKKEAKKTFFDYGLLKFKPANLLEVDTVNETFLSGFVSILNISNIQLKTNDSLYIEKNGRFKKAKILEIKVNDEKIESVQDGEIGIKTDIRIDKKSKVWVKNLP